MRLILLLLLLFYHTVYAKLVSFEDANIKYFGRWKKTTTDIQSVSSGAYLKTDIVINEQQRQIKLKLSKPASIYAGFQQSGRLIKLEAVDHGLYPIDLVIELPVNTTTTLISTLTIISDITSTLCLQAIETDDDVIFLKEEDQQPHLIEYVGHDLTLGLGSSNSILTSFPWIISTLLGTERSQIAFPGAWLMSHENQVGMESRYFEGTSFYSPRIVVVLLGEYDQYPELYAQRLSQFLTSVKNRFPKSIIFVLSEPLGVLFQESQAAVNYLNDVKSDQNVHFIDTTSWARYGPTYFKDPLHLNDLGQEQFARKLSPLIMAKINNQPFPGPQPNPNLPFNWQTMDVGTESSVGLTGSVSFDSAKTFTLWGSGEGFSRQDAFRFVYQTLSGNGSIQLTIESHSAFAACAKAGIMLREHLGSGSTNVMFGVCPQDGIFLQSRQGNAEATNIIGKRKLSPPYRLRLTRQGNSTLIAQIASTTDSAWETFSVFQNTMARDIYVGLAVTSCDPNVVSVAKFSEVTLTGGVGGGGFYYQRGLVIQQQ